MHNYFITPIVDVAVVRNEAQRRAFDKRSPEDSTIHHHPFDATVSCPEGSKHEKYEVGKGLVEKHA